MSMAIGSGTRAEINVTPLIDVLLVLLIIFLLVNPRKPNGLIAEIPQKPKTDQPQPEVERSVVLEVVWNSAGESSLRLNHEPVTWPELETRVVDVYKMRAEKVLFIAGDKRLDFEQVARAIDLAEHADPALRVGLMPPDFVGN